MTDLVIPPKTGLIPIDEGLSEKSKEYFHDASAINTQKTYARLWGIFQAWCIANERQHLPASPETIVDFLVAQATEKDISHRSLFVYTAAIGFLHTDMGFDPPPTKSSLVIRSMKGIKKKHNKKSKQKRAITIDELELMIAYCPDSLIGLRDASILSFHFSCAMRCSEPTLLKVKELEHTSDGVIVYLPNSKTGEAEIPLINISRINAIKHLETWLNASGITSGYVYRPVKKGDKLGGEEDHLCSRTIQQIWKKYAALAGLNTDDISGHSARSGFVTEVRLAGADTRDIKDVSRHTNDRMIDLYTRKKNMFINHAGRKIK